MQNSLIIAMAQLNLMLGDIPGNRDKLIAAAIHARDELNADVIVYPELAITAYPPEDLLLRPHFLQESCQALAEIQENVTGIHMVIGHPHVTGEGIFNAASVFIDKQQVAHYRKQFLPNFSVFDEKRYFKRGSEACIFEVKGHRLAVVICEDLWQTGPMEQAVESNADAILCLNASPFHATKYNQRLDMLRKRQANEGQLPIIYVNCVGGQDELVFDGGSVALSANGEIKTSAPRFDESIVPVSLDKDIQPGLIAPHLDSLESIYHALVCGTKDYLTKNHFHGALLGLSGGIDSALTCAIAADALGPENVHAVLMPSRYTAQMSIDDALLQANTLGVKHSTIPIEQSFNAFLDMLSDEFEGLAPDTTEENIQARCRGMILMALSNKTGRLVLTTGNKSELAVGYSTLYGDMAGGFNVLKDVPKTLVYQLSNFRNQQQVAIPQRVIDRAPSAELKEDQTDQDVLPPYDMLDRIIELYVTHNKSVEQIIADGIDAAHVKRVVAMIDRNEYKRRQAPPGIRISPRAFGRDWRFPITSAFGR